MSDELLAWSYAHWTPQQEKAYQTYRGLARRSLKQTADQTGIPLGTIKSWCRSLGWVLRVRDDDLDDGLIIRDYVTRALHNDLDLVVDRARHIALNSQDDRTALEAVKFLYQAGRETMTDVNDDERRRYTLDELRSMTREQKRALNSGHVPGSDSSSA
jgi:hypothetical protein